MTEISGTVLTMELLRAKATDYYYEWELSDGIQSTKTRKIEIDGDNLTIRDGVKDELMLIAKKGGIILCDRNKETLKCKVTHGT